VYVFPSHAVVGFAVMAFAAGVGIAMELHRFLSHRSFATWRRPDLNWFPT
jgi:fatty-acid desaturase